jgi:hypothetical protein
MFISCNQGANKMSTQKLGQCCKDMIDSQKIPENSMFRIESNGVMYLSIGYSKTDQGIVWFDQTVIYCPFCGNKIQDKGEIKNKAFN